MYHCFTIHIVLCKLYFVHCKLYSIQCTIWGNNKCHTAHCTLTRLSDCSFVTFQIAGKNQ